MKSDPTNVVHWAPFGKSGGRAAEWAGWFSAWCARHPVLAIVLVSWLTVVINCYPVVFCGKSFVSPISVSRTVYQWWPSLPGMDRTKRYERLSQHGSDTAATLWWEVPMGFVESRSLLHYGALPLWNRYSHAGDTLIGQAVSMLGDPLQLIVILGRGSAGAWDVKFLTAKFLFCVGFGLLILRLLQSRPMSLIYVVMAAYCGAFFYINNHPAFFVFAYAPWILLSALAWLNPQSEQAAGWGLVWLLANFACFNAGFVETAVVLIGGLNFTAVVYWLARQPTIAGLARVAGRMGLGTLLFLGLTAPMWMSFLATLNGAYSVHSEVKVTQLPLATLPGMFDDLFFLLSLKSIFLRAVAPGTSLLVMAGSLYSMLKWRELKGDTFFWVNGGAILLWSGFVFGWVPTPIIAAIPLLNRVGHIYADFCYLLAIHLTVQSAIGFNSLAREKNFRRAATNLLLVGLIFGMLLLFFCFGITHRPIPWDYFLCVGAAAIGAPLLFSYLKCHYNRIPAAGWTGVVILGFVSQFRFGLYTFGNDNLLMIPGQRQVLDAPSPAIEQIKSDHSDPFRVVGLEWNLAGDYSAVYGLEDIRSCAPLSNDEYINLVRKVPGVEFGAGGGWSIYVGDPVAAQPWLNLLNVKYLLAQPQSQPQIRTGPDFRIAGQSDFVVLENKDVWPRAFFSDKILTNSSAEEFVKQLWSHSQKPFVSLSPDALQAQPGLRALESTAEATIVPATNYRLLPNSTAFDIHAPSAGVVFLAEGQAKDFTVRANDESKEVLTANRAFKGVYLDRPGDYHIEFVYRPRHWLLACTLFWVSAAGIIALATLRAIRDGFKRERGKTEGEQVV